MVNKAYPASFHAITDGTAATTGTESPISSSLVDNLIKYVSPGDGVAAVATTKPKPHPRPIVPGSMDPH